MCDNDGPVPVTHLLPFQTVLVERERESERERGREIALLPAIV